MTKVPLPWRRTSEAWRCFMPKQSCGMEKPRKLLRYLSRSQRLKGRTILALAHRYLPLRGVGKVAFLQPLDVARASARRYGRFLTEANELETPDDVFFLVAPEFETQGFSIHWLDIAAPIGLGGLWLWLFLTQLRQRPLLPLRDPHLAEALEGAGGH